MNLKTLFKVTPEWKATTSKIFFGMLIYVLAGIVASILSPVASLLDTGAGLANFVNGGGSTPTSIIVLNWIVRILNLGIIAAVVVIFFGLLGMEKTVEGSDKKAVGQLKLAFILSAVAFFVGLFWGFGESILNIIAFIFMLIGYSGLKKSTALSELAKKGASLNFIAAILALVGFCVGIIPLIGGVIEAGLVIVAYVLTLVGWSKIKNA
ncbi:hypothetical protein FACS1894178_0860 [Bacteroidia bacterium]|nr:hypothetical protein FACS1894178_0860 [Bacteroidia bacterium]